jgi:hypothetical protein
MTPHIVDTAYCHIAMRVVDTVYRIKNGLSDAACHAVYICRCPFLRRQSGTFQYHKLCNIQL